MAPADWIPDLRVGLRETPTWMQWPRLVLKSLLSVHSLREPDCCSGFLPGRTCASRQSWLSSSSWGCWLPVPSRSSTGTRGSPDGNRM